MKIQQIAKGILKHQGKMVALILAIILFGLNPWGLILGLMTGIIYDYYSVRWKFLKKTETPNDWILECELNLGSLSVSKTYQACFLELVFASLGKLSRLQGLVSEKDIVFCESLMARLGIRLKVRQKAIYFFGIGKLDSYYLDERIKAFAELTEGSGLKYLFFDILLDYYKNIARNKSISEEFILSIIPNLESVIEWQKKLVFRFDAIKAQEQQREQDLQNVSIDQSVEKPVVKRSDKQKKFQDACQVFGVTENISMIELKKVYRRLMSIHHPDKQSAQASAVEKALSKEKAQDLTVAYEIILDKLMSDKKKI
jgi:DnaJ like chaperone protein